MSYTPFNESPRPILKDTNKDGMNIQEIRNFLQGIELTNPLNLRKGLLPRLGLKTIRTNQDGFVDNGIEINDLGQEIKASTTAFTDTTERWTPAQIIQDDLSSVFLNELITQQVIDEEKYDGISIFEPNGMEVPFTSRGTKCSLNSSNPFYGSQLLSPKYHDVLGKSDFLDGQENILGIAVPAIQTTDHLISLPFDDIRTDESDRFGINILNQDIDQYDRYASQGFVYTNNVRDSIAFGGLKD